MQAVQFRVARPTNQLKEIIRFYTYGLGLHIIGSFKEHEGYDGVMLGLPGLEYHLEFTRHHNRPNCSAPSKENLLVSYFDQEEKYNSAIERFKIIGVSPVVPANPYWTEKSKTFEDPDGWRVVLYNGIFK